MPRLAWMNGMPSGIHSQTEMFRCAESEGLKSSDELGILGWSIDDLVYEKRDGRRWSGTPAPNLNDLQIEENNIPFVSFFSGCGGMDIGFEAAGFQHIAGFESTLCSAKRYVKIALVGKFTVHLRVQAMFLTSTELLESLVL